MLQHGFPSGDSDASQRRFPEQHVETTWKPNQRSSLLNQQKQVSQTDSLFLTELVNWSEGSNKAFVVVGLSVKTAKRAILTFWVYSPKSRMHVCMCQSSVVCVMCPHLMFPYLVCFLSLFNVIISSFMSSRVCLIIYDLPVYFSSCLFSLMSSGLLVIPGVSCLWVLPCPVMSCLDVLIKYYHLSLYPRLRVPVPPSCVHRDRRPDQNRKRRPFTPYCFLFWKVFILFQCLCMSVPRHGSRRSSFPP